MKGSSSIASSLIDLTKKKSKLECAETCGKSLQELKERITSTLVLMLPKCGENYTIYCKTSRVCLGCILI